MNHSAVHLLDLPDEILLIIMKKLGSIDVLYSLLGTNQRLDQMARSAANTGSLNFSITLPNDQFSSIDYVKINRLCCEILSQIHHNVIALILDIFTMEHILLACEYPKLDTIVLTNFLPDIFSQYLTDESRIVRLFREQIRSITVKSGKEMFTSRSFSDTCVYIFTICRNLLYLNMNQWLTSNHAHLSICDRSPNVCFSSHLRTLFINVVTFDDCLCLLDGRLEQLSSFTVRIFRIKRSTTIDNNQKILSNLKEFSLTSYFYTNAYDCRILSLLHRVPSLNTLTLCLYIIRSTVIDGFHLNDELLMKKPHLNTFKFHICTVFRTSETNNFLTVNHIENTFRNWKYSSVSCCIDHFSDGYSYCHIYSIPSQITRFMYLTNSFRGHRLQYVTYLSLYDTRPFERDFFEWVARAFPLLKYLIVHNLKPQKNKHQVATLDDKQISYLHLFRINLVHAHIDYVYQFLCHTNTYLLTLHTLAIQYEKLATVSNNFTNDTTRINCGQIKQLIFNQSLVYPKNFYDYFPFF